MAVTSYGPVCMSRLNISSMRVGAAFCSPLYPQLLPGACHTVGAEFVEGKEPINPSSL